MNSIHTVLRVCLITLILVGSAFIFSPSVSAQGNCTTAGACIGGRTCVCQSPGRCNLQTTNPPCTTSNPTAITGSVVAPKGVIEYNAIGGGIGILRFASQVVFLLNVGAGLFAMYNFLIAGLTYVSSAGSADAHNKVKDKLTYTFVGLALIVSTYTVGGLIGLIFYGDAGFLLNPQLQGAL